MARAFIQVPNYFMNNMKPEEYLKFRKLDEKAIQMLVTGECYYSSPLHFNDPLDCSYSLENFPSEILEDLPKIFSNERRSILDDLHYLLFKKRRQINCGVVSFCGKYSHPEATNPFLGPDLWGHYADNHKGICIGFSPNTNYSRLDVSSALNPVIVGNGRQFKSPGTDGSITLLSHIMSTHYEFENLLSSTKKNVVKVIYQQEFSVPEPNWDVVRANYKSFDKTNTVRNAAQLLDNILKDALDVKKIVSNKHMNWKSENEYRLFGVANKSQSIGSAISSITFGLETNDDVKKYIASILSRFYGVGPVGLFKMIFKNRTLVRIPLEMNDAMPSSSYSIWGYPPQ
ncbi:MAG TPA: hypothetical protein DCE80_08000 [Ignavibacteriales bacterium]|nr:hypothetical protein [Ignavibacteriales bacterium]